MKQMIDIVNAANPDAQTTSQNFSNKLTKETVDLFRLLPNKKICYVGAIGHIRWQSSQDDIMRIEY